MQELLYSYEFEHKSLNILKSSNYSRLHISFFEEVETKNPRAFVEWEKIFNEVRAKTY